MVRVLLILVAMIVTAGNASAPAQGRRAWDRGGLDAGSWRSRHHHHHPHHDHDHRGYRGWHRGGSLFAPSTLFGFSFGTVPYGYDFAGYPDPYFLYPYAYDPWARGSFREPDLLDDPYFYDRAAAVRRYSAARFSAPRYPAPRHPAPRHPASQYPAPRLAQPGAPPLMVPAPGQRHINFDGSEVMMSAVDVGERIEALQSSSERLLLHLASFGGGEAWIDYLALDRIMLWAGEGNVTEIRNLLARFDGVSGNPEYRAVAQMEGFAETRNLLRQFLSRSLDGQPIEATPAEETPAEMESLPAPRPDATLESSSSDTSDI